MRFLKGILSKTVCFVFVGFCTSHCFVLVFPYLYQIKCAAGNVLMPDASNLQMNGDVCTDVIKMERHLACEYCDAHNFDLESSACSNKGPDYIDGFEFSDGD